MLTKLSSSHSAVVHPDVSCSQDKLLALPLNVCMYKDRGTEETFSNHWMMWEKGLNHLTTQSNLYLNYD